MAQLFAPCAAEYPWGPAARQPKTAEESIIAPDATKTSQNVMQMQQALQVDLPQTVGDFELAGGARPTLREVNGGSRCPGANGMEPPGYQLSGPITLEECAEVARGQPSVVGFRWGSHQGVNQQAYLQMTQPAPPPPAPPPRIPLAALFDIGRVFAGEHYQGFTCFVYMVNSSGHSPDFRQESLGGLSFVGDVRDKAGHATLKRKRGRTISAMPTRNSGSEVCGQRWSVLRFLQTSADSFWFCYMKSDDSARLMCDANAKEDTRQACIFTLGCLALLFGGSLILQNNRHFSFLLEWVVKFILTQELALTACMLLIRQGLDAQPVSFALYVLAFTWFGTQLVQVPVALLDRCFGQLAPTMVTFYYLFIVYTPSFFADWVTYYRPLPLLFAHMPRILGLAGLGLEMLKHFLLGVFYPEVVNDLEDDHFCQAFKPQKLGSHSYIPMQARRADDLNIEMPPQGWDSRSRAPPPMSSRNSGGGGWLGGSWLSPPVVPLPVVAPVAPMAPVISHR